MQRLDSLYEINPNENWTLVKEIKEDCTQSEDQFQKLSLDRWVKHFSTPFSKNEEFKSRNLFLNNVCMKKRVLGHLLIWILKPPKRKKSIAIKKLKNKKSSEMFKCDKQV
jgi:hypothetical protein